MPHLSRRLVSPIGRVPGMAEAGVTQAHGAYVVGNIEKESPARSRRTTASIDAESSPIEADALCTDVDESSGQGDRSGG